MKVIIFYIFMVALQLAFTVLKTCGVINWSWWAVLIPILFIVALNIAARLFLWWLKRYAKRKISRMCIKTPWD